MEGTRSEQEAMERLDINNDKDVVPIMLKKDFWKKIIDNFPKNMELENNFLSYYESVEDLGELINKLN